MIARIIAASARHRVVVLFAVAALALAGYWALRRVPLDALPDLSDVEVIIHTPWPGQPPNLVEDQVTYPIVTALLGAPRVQAVRAQTMFGDSYVFVVFKDGTDLYWARSRVLEYLQELQGRLPAAAHPALGPDATGAGWVYEYALLDPSHTQSVADLRALQKWDLRLQLETVPGVAEVATIGGRQREYEVRLDPNKLRAFHIPLSTVVDRVRSSAQEVGGRLLDLNGAEYMIRGLGYLRSLADLRNIPVATRDGVPILVGELGDVGFGPALRRGAADWNGEGEVVGGIVVMRSGGNALSVINAVKRKLAALAPSLPPGVEIRAGYDRSGLILASVATLRRDLVEEAIVVALVIFLFLWHFRSALIPILTIPIALLAAFLPMYFLHVSSNIMSLGGLALAVGVLVDAGIVMVENGHRHWAERQAAQAAGSLRAAAGGEDARAGGDQGPAVGEAEPPATAGDDSADGAASRFISSPAALERERRGVLLAAARQVGPALFFSLLIIVISFLPVFLLQAQEGRMFSPLAWTKTLAIAFSSLLAITLVPALMPVFIRGSLRPEHKNPVSRLTQAIYRPVLRACLRRPKTTLLVAVACLAAVAPLARRLGSQFMPPLYEGSALFMPTALPGISIGQASALLREQDRVLRSFPEVVSVFGTVGRSDSATDNAPLSMFDTTVMLKPKSAWPPGVTYPDLIQAMDAKLQIPGLSNTWTMPVANRLDMELTGIKTPVGLKIQGPSLAGIEHLGARVTDLLSPLPGVRSVFAERVGQGFYVNIAVNRAVAARYGLGVADVQRAVRFGIGGEDVAENVVGRARFPISVRYNRDFRSDLSALGDVLLATPSGAEVPLRVVASLSYSRGPAMIRDEGGRLTGYVYLNLATHDYGGFVARADRLLRQRLRPPPGYTYSWSGEFTFAARARRRLELILPLVLALIFVLLVWLFRSAADAALLIFPVAFALLGGLLLQLWLGYNFSVAVAVGYIDLFGIAVETSVVMMVYLREAMEETLAERRARGVAPTAADLEAATIAGAVHRLRPKLMTVAAVVASLGPLLWESGIGSDVMKPIAAPVIGGMATSTLAVMILVPVLFLMLRRRAVLQAGR